MASRAATEGFNELVYSFSEEDGVSVAAEGLLVHGTVFARLEGDDLLVELPPARAADLVERGIAERFAVHGQSGRNWARVSDLQLWPELAREAHEYVGEPPVGGDS
ncbi:MAG: hypothetical protein QOI70_657 [Microbacteriaceae bacterium]|jgi:hypothetical protein|nr:hypothetical protein [Microbacteriaceae bacterium]